MLSYVRQIEKAKWKPEEKLKVACLPSDAITRCLRTLNNDLSVWQFNFDDDDDKIIDEGVLALASGYQKTKIEAIDVVLLESRDLKKKHFKITLEDGKTHVKDLVEAHRNISNLTYAKLGKLAKIILKKLYKNIKVGQRTKLDTFKLMIKAFEEKRMEYNKLNKKMRNEINKCCKLYGTNIETCIK